MTPMVLFHSAGRRSRGGGLSLGTGLSVGVVHGAYDPFPFCLPPLPGERAVVSGGTGLLDRFVGRCCPFVPVERCVVADG